MAPPCKICIHPDRTAIEMALAKGDPPIRIVAAQFGCSTTGLQRHKANHLRISALTADEAKAARVAKHAPEQRERSLIAALERDSERAGELSDLANRLAYFALGVGADGAGVVAPENIRSAAEAVSAAVGANGGGVLNFRKVLGQATGELQTTKTQVIVLPNGQLSKDAERFADRFAERMVDLVLEVFAGDPRLPQLLDRMGTSRELAVEVVAEPDGKR